MEARRRLQGFNRTCNRESGRQRHQVTKQWWSTFEWTTAASRWRWLFEGTTAARRRWLGEGTTVAARLRGYSNERRRRHDAVAGRSSQFLKLEEKGEDRIRDLGF
ncbi:uncharacterized protein DS421_13g408500 [Arachis hypogaea]|nr:uncharacterized protein DS421_13g408500 [Arachis hypogaea]